MKVYIDAIEWGFSRNEEKDHFFARHTPKNSGCWRNIEMSQYSEAEWVICFDSHVRNHHLNKKKILQVRQEPDLIHNYKRIKIADAFLDHENDVQSIFWFINRPFDELNELKHSDLSSIKKNKCSAIFSNKYTFRNDFFSSISKELFDIDFYGRNIESIVGNRRNKGPLTNGLCKIEGLVSYEKSIAIENSSQKNYFTEKLIDCFMTWTMPIYWGCPNIFELFPKESIRCINLDDLDDLKEKIEIPVTKIELEAIEEARQLAINKFNFWPAIKRKIDKND